MSLNAYFAHPTGQQSWSPTYLMVLGWLQLYHRSLPALTGVTGARASTAGVRKVSWHPGSHLVNMVHNFLHAVLHPVQVLVFSELGEGHREIPKLASSSQQPCKTESMNSPSLTSSLSTTRTSSTYRGPLRNWADFWKGRQK